MWCCNFPPPIPIPVEWFGRVFVLEMGPIETGLLEDGVNRDGAPAVIEDGSTEEGEVDNG